MMEILNQGIITLIVIVLVSLLLTFWGANFARWFLKHQEVQWIRRCISLVFAGIIGIVFANEVYQFFIVLKDENVVLRSSLTIVALGLPTFFMLWLLRTHDVQRQINKTKENTNNSTLFECVRMLTEENPKGYTKENSLSAKIALEQLAYLRREPGFDKERVNLITQGLSLRGIYLRHANLGGLDLSESDLSNARLEGADLIGTNLSGSNLEHAYLQGTNLSNFVDDVQDKNKWQFAAYDHKSNFSGTWLESTDARGEALMVFGQSDESA